MSNKYDSIKLENQLCFPLYAVSNKIIRSYKPFLDKLNLTYTQYITMMVLWGQDNINQKQLGEKLYLKSNTLTPLLKKLEEKGYINIYKSSNDERQIIISLTKLGIQLKDQAIEIPKAISESMHLEIDEITNLYNTLYKILDN